ncbi:carbamoyltransferase HypF [Halioxenophilus sp. WMMB6]|uniref:carbamoyltransferase HypF n=1 Tax=Halioxenophilus sp. WMMB6 TaxID=3073815 RepID=UPI00295EAACA|nr:carbamoyltransferase HypF [Halioxenophilus sp. WMMB6]
MASATLIPPVATNNPLRAKKLTVRGVVQGVGFRPTVFRLARANQITGWVANCGEGVEIFAWYQGRQLESLLQQLQQQLPPLARIDGIETSAIEPSSLEDQPPPQDFTIRASRSGLLATSITADAATCPHCLSELFEPGNRRYHYPFINCTHCGPRFSIVNAIPYDRANTSMAGFAQCPSCLAEYHHPGDRRFHAQPNACPVCGPAVWLVDKQGLEVTTDDAVARAAQQIAAGLIVAIKGLGGFQLAVDASNAQAIARLRQLKQRPSKPLALMARDLSAIQPFAELCPSAESLLNSAAAPIVLLPKRGAALPEAIAPGQSTLGVMLANTPLHHLLLAHLQQPIVLTSGNARGEPQIIDNGEALAKLAAVADSFLLHNRPISNRVDDSLVQVIDQQPRLLRRGRGYAPESLPLPEGFSAADGLLAMGADLKNSFCLLHKGRAVTSQYIGDLHHPVTQAEFAGQLQRFAELYQFQPHHIAIDQHPRYVSSQLGRQWAASQQAKVTAVQHHHAHIASVMAEHGLPLASGPVLGIALDGLGYGSDGTLWGGELLLADYRSARRLAHFQPLPLLGGDKANIEPWRNALSQLLNHSQWPVLAREFRALGIVQFLQQQPLPVLTAMAERGLNSPQSSSAGRLFDAVAAVLGLCVEQQSYEGEAACLLEALAVQAWDKPLAPYEIEQSNHQQLSWAGLWRPLLADLQAGVAREVVAARFHRTVIERVADVAHRIAAEANCSTVVLAGGVMQNQLILTGLSQALQPLKVLSPRLLPANDGGLALGQAVIAFAQNQSMKPLG